MIRLYNVDLGILQAIQITKRKGAKQITDKLDFKRLACINLSRRVKLNIFAETSEKCVLFVNV